MAIVSPIEPEDPRASLAVGMTPLLGRDTEIGSVRALLDAGDTRLVTLTGPGGIGKTRLALAVAVSMEADFAHGAPVVSLASVDAAGQVPAAVAEGIGLQPSTDVTEAVAACLQERHMLLVLDNLEHVVDGAARWVSDLLAACPRLHVLATSRTPLRIEGERQYPVEPLEVPATVPDLGIERIAESAAVRLFLTRARAVRSSYALTQTSAQDIAAICRAVDGVPLAIELAAARVSVLSPAQILARLSGRLTLLAGGERDRQSRHQTMRDAIAWSYDLLSGAQQDLFRRLAVFSEGFSIDAAEAMVYSREALPPGAGIVDLMAGLIDHSLVRQVFGSGGEARFGMLEVIRQFGLERLDGRHETTAARDAHADWYLAIGPEAERGLESGEQRAWLDRLETDHANLRSAFGWLLERGRVAEAAELALNLSFYFFIHGRRRELGEYLESLLAHPQLNRPALARARALLAFGGVCLGLGRSDQAMAALDEALPIFRDHGEHRCAAMTLANIGLVVLARHDVEGASRAFEESVSLARKAGSARTTSAGLSNLGLIAWLEGRIEDAYALQEEALGIARSSGDDCIIAQILADLGDMASSRGEYDRAEPLLRQSLVSITALGDRRDLPKVLIALARIAHIHGDSEVASAHLEDAFDVARETGDRDDAANAVLALGHVRSEQGRHAEATRLLQRAIAAFRKMDAPSDVADCLDALAGVAARTGDMTPAARFLGAADAVHLRIGVPRPKGLPREEYRDRKSEVRAALGDTAFTAAYNAGRMMALNEAVTDARAFRPIRVEQRPVRPMRVSGLSQREAEVLRLMADGFSNQRIADELCISRRTVTSHVSSILGKLALPSRTAAVAWAMRNGLA